MSSPQAASRLSRPAVCCRTTRPAHGQFGGIYSSFVCIQPIRRTVQIRGVAAAATDGEKSLADGVTPEASGRRERDYFLPETVIRRPPGARRSHVLAWCHPHAKTLLITLLSNKAPYHGPFSQSWFMLTPLVFASVNTH